MSYASPVLHSAPRERNFCDISSFPWVCRSWVKRRCTVEANAQSLQLVAHDRAAPDRFKVTDLKADCNSWSCRVDGTRHVIAIELYLWLLDCADMGLRHITVWYMCEHGDGSNSPVLELCNGTYSVYDNGWRTWLSYGVLKKHVKQFGNKRHLPQRIQFAAYDRSGPTRFKLSRVSDYWDYSVRIDGEKGAVPIDFPFYRWIKNQQRKGRSYFSVWEITNE